jgi:hypothetical protein
MTAGAKHGHLFFAKARGVGEEGHPEAGGHSRRHFSDFYLKH